MYFSCKHHILHTKEKRVTGMDLQCPEQTPQGQNADFLIYCHTVAAGFCKEHKLLMPLASFSHGSQDSCTKTLSSCSGSCPRCLSHCCELCGREKRNCSTGKDKRSRLDLSPGAEHTTETTEPSPSHGGASTPAFSTRSCPPMASE